MPADLYCWRCDRVIPMLDEVEWAKLAQLLPQTVIELKAYMQAHGVSLGEAQACGFDSSALACYRSITGFAETNVNALWHHRLSLYGPLCKTCGKPLRTPSARHCAACGQVRENALMQG